ncbi:uncharacterized protein LOC134692131 [Mytilus trossulus]|uniref:uncharacterized protein LOC134692131 n=1 Tax=Mytilus trossulus TaxID=6551 RepID=UPI0030043732
MSEKLAQVFLIVFTSMFVFTLTVCKAAPMGDYIQDTEELTNSASANLMLSPQYREAILRNLMSDQVNQSTENDSVPYSSENLKRSSFRRMMSAAKRMALARSSRGGVALCLWKVCPAGPWLSRQ